MSKMDYLVLLKTGEVGVAAAANVAHVWLVTDDSFGLLRLLGHLLLLLLLKSHVHALELEVVHALVACLAKGFFGN